MAATFLTNERWDFFEDELMQEWLAEKQENKTMSDIAKWKHLATELKKLKVQEAELRRELCEIYLHDQPLENGRATAKLHDGHYAVKAVQTLGYTIDQGALSAIWDHLTDEEKSCIKLKPELILSNFKKLPATALLNEAVVSRLAMPTLTAELEEI